MLYRAEMPACSQEIQVLGHETMKTAETYAMQYSHVLLGALMAWWLIFPFFQPASKRLTRRKCIVFVYAPARIT
jgi:hypothetical protein